MLQKTGGLTPGGRLANPSSVVSASTGFQSTQQTGTGTQQTIAHGLGVVPSKVIVEIDYIPALPDVATQPTTFITQGTHTRAAVLITALSGLKYRVLALP